MLLGDFNDIIDNSKKSGGTMWAPWTFKDFNNFIYMLGAVDLGYRGKPWIWSSYRINEGLIQEWLDRVLVSHDWKLKYDHAMVLHIQNNASDHELILCSTNGLNDCWKKRFYFDKR